MSRQRAMQGEELENRVLAECTGKTAHDIAEAIPEISRKCADFVLRRLHAQRRVHICGYVTQVRGPQPKLWAAGAGNDAPKPPPSSRAKSCKAYRARLRKNGDYIDVLAAMRSRNLTHYHCGKRDAFTVVFFGEAR